ARGGTAQVRGDHARRAAVARQAGARHRGADARVFADLAGVVERHVQVGADEYALAVQRAGLGQRGQGVDLGHAAYLADISATVVSSMRFGRPHSLSYHDDTLTSLPDTLVSVES